LVKVIVDGEGLLYSDWLPLIAGNSTGFVGFISTFRGVFYIKGITVARPPTIRIALFLRVFNFPELGVAL